MIDKHILRLGNWINCHFQTTNFNAQVLEIRQGGVLVQDGEHKNVYGYDNVSPIALTDAILFLCGFDVFEVEACLPNEGVGLLKGNGRWFLNNDEDMNFGVPLLTVHQLQNAVFFKTEKELNVRL